MGLHHNSKLHLFCVALTAILQLSGCHPSSYNEFYEHLLWAANSKSSRIELETAVDDVATNFEGIKRQDIVDAFTRYLESLDQAEALKPSPQCMNDTVLFIEGLISRDRWALEMIDSYGKPGSGLLQVQTQWFGSFDECVGVDVAINSTNNTAILHPFNSKYCLAIHQLTPGMFSAFSPVIELGTCFPESCSSTDVLLILNEILHEISPNSTVGSVSCQEELSLDGPAIAVLVVLGIFVVLLITGTAYDIIYVQMPQWTVEELDTAVSKNSVYGEQNAVSDNGVMSSGAGEYTPLISQLVKTYKELHTPGILGKVILSFSVYTNGKKLLSTKQSAESLGAVHGIRFLSMTWVILGHTYFFGAGMYANMFTALPEMLKRWTFDAIDNATVSVDTFFLLSGLLVGYLALKEMKKGEGRLNWFMFYFHRYWRLTPPYMFVIMIYVPLFKYWGTGPSFPQKGVDQFCKNNFWLNLLYIQNIVRDNEQCMGWAWYLANDMQFYILSPLIFVPFYYSTIFGGVMAGLFLGTTIITAGIIASVYDLPASAIAIFSGQASATGAADYMPQYYFKPWCRMGPYIIGLVTGYILYRTKCRIRMNRIQCFIGWVSAAAICLAVLYGLDGIAHGHKLSTGVSSFYNALHRTAWGVGVAWVVVACVTGNGGFVNTILSWSALIPLSRLTYCAYLVHPVVMMFYFFSRHSLFFISDLNMIYCFFGNLVASYLVAAVISLAFESPMMGLEKAILSRTKKE